MSARIGSSLYVVARTQEPTNSDDESTEPVNQRKPVMGLSTPMMEEDLWWQMNQDFACCGEEEEDFIIPSRCAYSQPDTKKKTIVRTSVAPTLGDDEWMAMNQDFACDHSHEDMMDMDEAPTPAKKVVPALEEPLGDYGVWWE